MTELSDDYVFWLYDFSAPMLRSILKGFPNPGTAQIGSYELVVNKYRIKKIMINEIKRVDYEFTGGSTTSYYEVTTWLNDGKGIALAPMNPLAPNVWLGAKFEAEAMVAVIEAFRQGKTPDLDPNPYHRELKRQGREDEISRRVWDPYVSPWVYYRQDHPRPSLSKILLLTVATILALAIGVALLVFLLETLSGGSL